MWGEGGVGGAGNDDGSGVLGRGTVFVAPDVDFPNEECVMHPAIKIITVRINAAPEIKNRIRVASMTGFCVLSGIFYCRSEIPWKFHENFEEPMEGFAKSGFFLPKEPF